MIDPNLPAFPVQENNGLTGPPIRLKIAADVMSSMYASLGLVSPEHHAEISKQALLATDELLKQFNYE